jgi:hypothetical protein
MWVYCQHQPSNLRKKYVHILLKDAILGYMVQSEAQELFSYLADDKDEFEKLKNKTK